MTAIRFTFASCLLALCFATLGVTAIDITLTQPTTQQYLFTIDWTGYATARLELGNCPYLLSGTATGSDGSQTVTQGVNELSLLNDCGYTKTIDNDNINIQGSVRFFSLSTTDDRLLYTGQAYITYPLITRANSQTTIRLLEDGEVGVDVVIPSALTLCGETSMGNDDPRLTTTVGSNLCFRHTITSTSSSLLTLSYLTVSLAGNDMSSNVHSLVNSISGSGYVEYRMELASGPCLTCQYTSTLYLMAGNSTGGGGSLVAATTKGRLIAASGSTDTATTGSKTNSVAKASLQLNIQGGTDRSDDYDPIFSHRQLEAVALTALLLAGVSFLMVTAGMIYHHCGRKRDRPDVVVTSRV